MKLSLILALSILSFVVKSQNLVEPVHSFVRPYQQIINNISYGSSNINCFKFCQYGQLCTVNRNVASCKALCGDGIRAGSEASPRRCDDGNLIKKDGCDDSCNVEQLYECSGEPSICRKLCGDGVLNTLIGQKCDDGNQQASDGCSTVCLVNPNWQCTSVQGQKSTCTPICGDGVRVGSELTNARKCDDKNKVSGDGCNSNCQVQNLYKCLGTPSVCTNMCKNGKLNSSVGQLCDDGNNIDTDGCSNNCRVNSGWRCVSKQSLKSNCTRIP